MKININNLYNDQSRAVWSTFSMPHLKPKELITKSRADLLEQLTTLEKKLFELRGQKAQQTNKISELRTTRRDIARVKTILMIQQREALNKKFEGAKHVPIDLRKYEVKAKRNALPAKYANKLVKRAARRAKFLKPVKFAIKA